MSATLRRRIDNARNNVLLAIEGAMDNASSAFYWGKMAHLMPDILKMRIHLIHRGYMLLVKALGNAAQVAIDVANSGDQRPYYDWRRHLDDFVTRNWRTNEQEKGRG